MTSWSLNSDPILDTQSHRHWRLCGSPVSQVSMAGRSMERLWHKMAAAAVGFCIHVCRGSGGATGISVSLSKETGRGAALPRGDCTSTAEHLVVILTFLFCLPRFYWSSLWKFTLVISTSPYFSFSPTQLQSPVLFSGESAVPPRPVCASAEITSILSGGDFIVLFCFSPSPPHVQLSTLLCACAY